MTTRDAASDLPVGVSCVIALYNEEKNVSKVLDVVTTYDKFDEILVINDGSHDNTKSIVDTYRKKCRRLQLITMHTNVGKTGAVAEGIRASTGDLIEMVDGDLIGLSHDNLDSLIAPVLNGEVDQTILDRAGDRTQVWGWTNFAKYFGGERAFWKKDFLDIDLPKNGGYLLEIVNNLHYLERGKKLRTIFCKDLFTVHQFKKRGWITGSAIYYKMIRSIFHRATAHRIFTQVFWIENGALHGLFATYRKIPLLRPMVGPVILLCHLSEGIGYFLWLNARNLIRIFTTG